MCDLISRSALFKEFERIAWYNNADRDEIAEEVLLQMPAVDAVEVVRCRDCKYYKEGELLAPEKFCFRLMHPTENRRIGYNFADDDFCSYGERKDDDT